jgi:hypothetical protein
LKGISLVFWKHTATCFLYFYGPCCGQVMVQGY